MAVLVKDPVGTNVAEKKLKIVWNKELNVPKGTPT